MALKVLVIDDNEDNLISLKALISLAFPESKLLLANRGKQGLELAVAENPDVVLLDILMPGMDGFEVCRELKRNEKTSLIPVVFLTALDSDNRTRIQALDTGAEAFLSKPVEETELQVLLKAMSKIKTANILMKNENERLNELVAERTMELEQRNEQMKLLVNDLQNRMNMHQETLADLQKSEEKYRLMFETALEGILIAQDYKLVYFNPVMLNIAGYSSEELMGMPFINIIHPDDHELVTRNYNNRLVGGKTDQSYEFRILRKNGEIRWVVLTGAKLIWNGKPATFNFINDITDRKQAELQLKASEEKYRLITENTSDVIWILNLGQMKFTYISPSIINLRGYTVQEAMNQSLDESLTPESGKMVEETLRATIPEFLSHKNSGLTRSLNQIQQPCKDGRIIWVEVATQYQFNQAGEVEVLGVSRNIEERKKMEDELRRSEVELRELIATKDKFFSIIAHDLKSPFNSIAGFGDLLQSEARSLDIDEIIQYAGLINTSAKNTMALLENLLDWAQVQRGQMLFNPKPALIGELLKEALAVVRQAAVQKGIAIQSVVPEDFIFSVDENMFKLLIRNLVGNAVKFTHRGGRVEIKIEANNKFIKVLVKDNGIGISTGNIEKLFNISAGYVARGTANEKGTGLGLILCKEFVEKHSGRIWVESKEGEGSNFIVELPIKDN
ncbi:MAG TPA: hypothetical protein DER09_01885 [Prolixibacteraceae bacterium]|nr:hypothetical protein [Prolixibacteraceae bacterium]